MRVSELVMESNRSLKRFVDGLGLDGRFYVSNNNTPVGFMTNYYECKFLPAKSKELLSFLESHNMSNRKNKYLHTGVIVLGGYGETLDEQDQDDMLEVLNHERLHANRMILLNIQSDSNPDVPSVFYDKEHLVQNTANKREHYADASQGIIKGSIDTANSTIDKYKKLTRKKKYEIDESSNVHYNKMNEQQAIDEALILLMSKVATRMHKYKSDDVMEAVRSVNKKTPLEDVKAVSNIILRHNDLDLFKWMISPLEYQMDDINYDYFNHYLTPEDMEDYETLCNSFDSGLDDDKFDEMVKQGKI